MGGVVRFLQIVSDCGDILSGCGDFIGLRACGILMTLR